MRNREMKRLRAKLPQLTPGQRKIMVRELEAIDWQSLGAEVIAARLTANPACVHCGGRLVVKHGTTRNIQRYRCRDCKKTFCALTGSPVAGLHKRDKWLKHAEALREGWTVRKVARELDMAVSTAFRWRHRFLSAPKTAMAQSVSGIVEADETYFLRSLKGQRKDLNRPPRQRGGKASKPGISEELVPVLVVRDRAGATADFLLKSTQALVIRPLIAPLFPADAALCTDGSKSLAAVAHALKIEHHPVNLSAGVRVDGPWHIQNVNAYHSRLKHWLLRFRGVATRYLESYLGWFRVHDRSPPSGLQPAVWLALALG